MELNFTKTNELIKLYFLFLGPLHCRRFAMFLNKFLITGRDVAARILEFLETHNVKIEDLICVGGDATASNSGPFVSIDKQDGPKIS